MTLETPAIALETPATRSAFGRIAIFAYGVLSYGIGVAGLCWLIAATLDLVPFTGGGLATGSVGTAIAVNLALVAVFGVQHAVMARPEFKERWTRIVPRAIERSTFTLLAGGIMAAAMWLWQPVPGVIWSFDAPVAQVALRVVGCLGWAYLFAATFAIDHFELFGLKQVYRSFQSRKADQVPFVMRWMYRFDRHPIMTGVLIGVWSTPVMRLDHLVLAAGLSTYIVLGVAIEERDLVRLHGESYREYSRQVGSPHLPGKRDAA